MPFNMSPPPPASVAHRGTRAASVPHKEMRREPSPQGGGTAPPMVWVSLPPTEGGPELARAGLTLAATLARGAPSGKDQLSAGVRSDRKPVARAGAGPPPG